MNDSNTLIIERHFNAPLQLVWDVHSKPEHLTKWWGPKGFEMKIIEMDFRPGGILHYYLENSQGFKMWGKVIYNELLEPEKMVFINGFSNETGDLTRHPMSDTWPLEIHNTMTLTAQNEQTLLTLKSYPINATEQEVNTFIGGLDSVRAGFSGMLDQLEEYLNSHSTG